MERKNDSWGSRFGFIMTAAGFSIGLGNMWRFPYLVGTEGGGAFVIIYLLTAIFIGIPLFTMEMSLGRKGQASPILAMQGINGKGNKWNAFGWLGVASAFFILTYYIQIMGWIVGYLWKNVTNAFAGQTTEQVAQSFEAFRSNSLTVAILTILCLIVVGMISAKGLEKGVEAACKVMMPALGIMMIIMVVRSLMMPNSFEGVKWYLQPDFSKITGKTFLNALGQVFFSIGIASGGAMVYGSYLAKDSDIPSDGIIIIFFDTLAALMAGLIMFPAIFSMGMEPGQGPGLLFVTMSRIFAEMPAGQLFGAIFFLLVFFAALSSALGYLEPVATTVRDICNVDRKKAVWLTLIVAFVVGFPTILALGPWKHITILGMNIFDFDDFWSGNVLMPLGAIVLSLYVIFQWKFETFKKDANCGATKVKVSDYWKPLVYVVLPIALITIFVVGIYNVL